MGLFTRRPEPTRRARVHRSVTAAAQSASDTSPGLQKLNQDWQTRALGYYDQVGECWYTAQFYARSLARTRFFPAILDERGDPQEVTTGPLIDLFQRIRDPGGSGMTELASSYGRLRFLIGDGYLTVTEQNGEESWEYLSPLELRVTRMGEGDPGPQQFSRLRAPGVKPEDLVEAPDSDFDALGARARVWRLYRRHPTYSSWADSPNRAVLDLWELLMYLTLAASAESKSRAANRGAIFVPDELDFGGVDADGTDEDPDSDPFMELLEQAIQNAIQNPGSAAAAAGIIIRGKGWYDTPNGVIATKDMIGHIPLGPASQYIEGEMWDKVIDRIALSLDKPREMVTGTGQSNHWGGWLVDEQAHRLHIAPVTQQFCDDLGTAYLRPAAMQAGITDADRAVIGYDAAAAINHPDEIKTAREMYLDGVVGPSYYRGKGGATDEDAPTPEEREELILLLAKKVEPDADVPDGETSPQDGGRGGDTEEGVPATRDDRGNGDTPAAAVAAARIGAAVELQVKRARELAGNRLIRRSQGCEECKESISGVPPALVAHALGREQVRAIIEGHTTEEALVAGAGEGLAEIVREWGYDDEVAGQLGRVVSRHALATLYDEGHRPVRLAVDLQQALA